MNSEERQVRPVDALRDVERVLLERAGRSQVEKLRYRKTIDKIIEKVQAWTGNQPFLTELLCRYVLANADAAIQANDPAIVDRLVKQKILKNWQKSDAADHLAQIQKSLLDYDVRDALLILYLQLLQRDSVAKNNSPEQSLLEDAGLIQVEGDRLKLSNALYPAIFNRAWIEQQLPGITRPVAIVKGNSPSPGSSSPRRVEPYRHRPPSTIIKPVLIGCGLAAIALAALLFLQAQRRSAQSVATFDASGLAGSASAENTQGLVQLSLLGDTFSGYSTFRDADFQSDLQAVDLGIRYADEFDQTLRAERLTAGEVDLIVTTLDQFLQQQPEGKIVGLLDRTIGADAVVLNTRQYAALNSLLDLNKLVAQARDKGDKLSIAYAADTPSEYLALVLDTQFDTFNLSDFTLKPVADASEAWSLMQDPKEKVAIAILWEPYVAKARQQGYSVVLSSKDAPNVIVDVLVASNQAIRSKPEAISQLLEKYYRRIDANIRDATQLQTQVAEDGNLSTEDAASIIQGIDFFTAAEAKRWFSNGMLTRRIKSTSAILTLSNRLAGIPTNSENLYSEQFVVEAANNTQALINIVEADNPKLAAKLAGNSPTVLPTKQTAQNNVQLGPDIGNFQVRGQVSFERDLAQLTAEGQQTIAQLASELQTFNEETIAVRVIGHTSRSGDANANLALSQQRAATVAQQLQAAGVKLDTQSEGKGFSAPLPNISPEDPRNQRTEIRLVRVE